MGGTRVADDWYPRPRPEITLDILTRALALCPELAPPEIRAIRTPTVEDLSHIVVGEGCGLRPSQKGGARLELLGWMWYGEQGLVGLRPEGGRGRCLSDTLHRCTESKGTDAAPLDPGTEAQRCATYEHRPSTA